MAKTYFKYIVGLGILICGLLMLFLNQYKLEIIRIYTLDRQVQNLSVNIIWILFLFQAQDFWLVIVEGALKALGK